MDKKIRNGNVVKNNWWLKNAGLKAEIEGLIIAAQDQYIPTRNYWAKMIKNESNQICRLSEQETESIDHMASGCPILRPKKGMTK